MDEVLPGVGALGGLGGCPRTIAFGAQRCARVPGPLVSTDSPERCLPARPPAGAHGARRGQPSRSADEHGVSRMNTLRILALPLGAGLILMAASCSDGSRPTVQHGATPAPAEPGTAARALVESPAAKSRVEDLRARFLLPTASPPASTTPEPILIDRLEAERIHRHGRHRNGHLREQRIVTIRPLRASANSEPRTRA